MRHNQLPFGPHLPELLFTTSLGEVSMTGFSGSEFIFGLVLIGIGIYMLISGSYSLGGLMIVFGIGALGRSISSS